MNRLRLIFGITFLLAIGCAAYAVATSGNQAFWIYWALIFTGLAGASALIFFNAFPAFTDWSGMAVGQLLSNNNWRWFLVGILCIVFTISAVLAGFGEPIFWSSAKTVTKSVQTELQKQPSFGKELRYVFFGEQTDGHDSRITMPTKDESSSYPSWWHWKFAILLWISFFIYTPIAWREETREAWNEAKALVQEGITHIDNIIDREKTAPTEPKPDKDKPARHSLMNLLSIEVIAEFVPILMGKMFRKIA